MEPKKKAKLVFTTLTIKDWQDAARGNVYRNKKKYYRKKKHKNHEENN